MNSQEVIDCWKQVFPNSAASARTIMGSSGFRFYIAKDSSETVNKIMDNDPLMYSAFLKDGEWAEHLLYMFVKPTTTNRVYSSVKMRKKTIKNVTEEELIKRFHQVRTFIMNNASDLKDPMFDITTK